MSESKNVEVTRSGTISLNSNNQNVIIVAPHVSVELGNQGFLSQGQLLKRDSNKSLSNGLLGDLYTDSTIRFVAPDDKKYSADIIQNGQNEIYINLRSEEGAVVSSVKMGCRDKLDQKTFERGQDFLQIQKLNGTIERVEVSSAYNTANHKLDEMRVVDARIQTGNEISKIEKEKLFQNEVTKGMTPAEQEALRQATESAQANKGGQSR